jgi:hypothetical protein
MHSIEADLGGRVGNWLYVAPEGARYWRVLEKGAITPRRLLGRFLPRQAQG